MTNILLVAIDDSEQSMRAVDYAVKLAVTSGYTIELINVQPKVNTHYANQKIGKKKLQEYKKEEATKILKNGRKRVHSSVHLKLRWRQGIIAQEICKEALEINAIGIVMGTRSLKKVKGRLLGSTCYSVIRFAHCPVTVVS